MTRVLLLAGLLQRKNFKLREVIGLRFPGKLLLITFIIRMATIY